MSAAYNKRVSDHFGKARVVYYNFHLIQNVVVACDPVQEAENRADAGKRDRLVRNRWIWLKNRINWTDKQSQKWDSMAVDRCVMGMAYEMRLVLQGIYQWKDVGEAKKLFGNWYAWVQAMGERTAELLEPKVRVAWIIDEHLKGIFAYWIRELTTAFREGLNSLFSDIKRKARGHRSAKYMTAMMHLIAGKLTLSCD